MRKPLLSVFISLLLFPLGLLAQNCYQLIWAEEFNYTGAPDPKYWGYDQGAHGWGNNELQNYTNSLDNARVENGKLIIRAVKQGSSWTSARLVTRQKKDFLYGRVEVRAKIPTGRGTWPAIWMLPTQWAYGNWPDSGEIDIMEHVGYDPGVIHGTVHTKAYNHMIGTQVGQSIQIPTFASQFHVYAIEWTESKIDFFVDNQKYFTFQNDQAGNFATWPFNKAFHLILNIAIGGNWGGAQGIDPNLTEAIMEVDYVRVYSKTELPQITGPDMVTAGTEHTFQVPHSTLATYQWIVPEGVTVISGLYHSEIKVKWNDQAGDLKVIINQDCGSVTTLPKTVNVKFVPEDDYWVIPPQQQSELHWKPLPGNGYSISLSLENGEDTHVQYALTQTMVNPTIVYEFAQPYDLSQYGFFGLKIKVPEQNGPRAVRLDIIDRNGNNNQHQLLTITSFPLKDQWVMYASPLTASSTFDPSNIKKIQLYFNYSIYGIQGSGSFHIREVYFAKTNPLSTAQVPWQQSNIYPNPARDKLYLKGFNTQARVSIFSLSGQMLHYDQGLPDHIPIAHFPAGIYLLQVHQGQEVFTRKFIKTD